MKCKVTKITSSHHLIPDGEFIGVCDKIPTIGESFQMTSTVILRGEGSYLHTTEVKEVEIVEDGMIFKTRNSTYKFEYELGKDNGNKA